MALSRINNPSLIPKGVSIPTTTAYGTTALNGLTTGTNNTAIGYQAAYYTTTGSTNTAVGSTALVNNTTASNNTGIGHEAGFSNTTGASNTALGQQALRSNTTASNNTAVGYQAGYSVSTSPSNTFLGYQAGYSTTNASNTHLGFQAGYNATTGTNNLTAGSYAGYSLTTGTGNTFVGGSYNFGCGYYITTGSKNTILGSYNGNQGSLDIRTASNYIVLSDGDGNPRAYADDSGNFYITASLGRLIINRSGGSSFRAVGVYNESAGTTNVSIDASGNFTRATSSLKYKKNVQDATFGLSDLLNLRPVTYQGKNPSEEGITYGGLIAEEVDALGLSQFVEYAVDGSPDALRYGNMVSLCIKAIQELKAEFDAYKATHP